MLFLAVGNRPITDELHITQQFLAYMLGAHTGPASPRHRASRSEPSIPATLRSRTRGQRLQGATRLAPHLFGGQRIKRRHRIDAGGFQLRYFTSDKQVWLFSLFLSPPATNREWDRRPENDGALQCNRRLLQSYVCVAPEKPALMHAAAPRIRSLVRMPENEIHIAEWSYGYRPVSFDFEKEWVLTGATTVRGTSSQPLRLAMAPAITAPKRL